jgi:hypothetical protein
LRISNSPYNYDSYRCLRANLHYLYDLGDPRLVKLPLTFTHSHSFISTFRPSFHFPIRFYSTTLFFFRSYNITAKWKTPKLALQLPPSKQNFKSCAMSSSAAASHDPPSLILKNLIANLTNSILSSPRLRPSCELIAKQLVILLRNSIIFTLTSIYTSKL